MTPHREGGKTVHRWVAHHRDRNRTRRRAAPRGWPGTPEPACRVMAARTCARAPRPRPRAPPSQPSPELGRRGAPHELMSPPRGCVCVTQLMLASASRSVNRAWWGEYCETI